MADWAIPVSSYWAMALTIPTDHPRYIGEDPSPWIEEADVFVAPVCLAPWQPARRHPSPDVTIIHIGPDPIFSRFPVRNFHSDITLTGESADTLPLLIAAMGGMKRDEGILAVRRAKIGTASYQMRQTLLAGAKAGNIGPMSKDWVSHYLGQALVDRPSTDYSELGTSMLHVGRREMNSIFLEPHSDGLGWGLPAALDRAIPITMEDRPQILLDSQIAAD